MADGIYPQILLKTRLIYSYREMQVVRDRIEELSSLSEAYGFRAWFGLVSIYEGQLAVEQGQIAEGIAQIRQGLMTHQTTGMDIHRPYLSTILVEALGKARQIEEGLVVLDEVLALVEKAGERFYEAELHRLKGELLRMQGKNEVEVETHFQKAIDVARGQKAGHWSCARR